MSDSLSWPCVALPHANLAERTTMRVGERRVGCWNLRIPKSCARPGALPANASCPFASWVEGANLVIEDGLHDCVVITTERLRRIFRPSEEAPEDTNLEGQMPPAAMAPPPPADNPVLVAWAGATLPALVRAARDLGYSGLEGIVGVPGQVGGGVAMNAGGRWGNMWDVIESVHVMDEEGELQLLSRDQCNPSYRNGGLGSAVVLGAVMRFQPTHKLEVEARMREYLLEKNSVQPVTEWSAGCVFKNP